MRALLPLLLGACTSFESEQVVLDLRVLAMAATVPDQLIEVDLANPPDDPSDVLDQLVPTTMCALVADPAEARRLRFKLTLCVLNNDERCRASRPQVVLVEGVSEDPDLAQPRPEMCATIEPDPELAAIVLAALEDSDFGGLGGVDYGVALQVGPEDGDPDEDLLAGKTLRLTPRIPDARTANVNPTVDRFTYARAGDEQTLPMGRCVDQAAPLQLAPGEEIRITPVEPEGARETYTVPTLDGMAQTFTESLTYQWLTGRGGSIGGSSGGTRDPVTGNPARLFTDFRVAGPDAFTGVTDVPIWVIQRDERLGAVWYESCVRVVP